MSALEYLHDLGFAHNDIKLENVILMNGRACLIDFDSMTKWKKVATNNEIGTPRYFSYEMKSMLFARMRRLAVLFN